ncbi:MAG: ATP-grasp domain-containing protein [Chloroflexota bacterium]
MTNQTNKRIIMLSSAQSYRGGAFEKAAKKLGVEIVIGEDIPLPFQKSSNAQLPLDYRDIKRSTNSIKKYAIDKPITAILGLDDSGTIIQASASQALGLAHNELDGALASRDKYLMRQRFAKNNVPSPNFSHHTFSEDMEKIAHKINYPCVIKPTTLSGSRGVMRADTPEDFLKRIKRLEIILKKERCNEFLVEDFIPGVEVALEGLLDNGTLHVLALFDKPDPLVGPFFEETIYVTPSRLPKNAQDKIVLAAEQAAQALGLVIGPIHAELRYNEKGAWLVEIAGRSIGGLCGNTLRFETHASLEELILRQALGMELSGLSRASGADGVMMIPIPEKGILSKIEGLELAMAVPWIDDVNITFPLNYPLVPLPEGNSYLGFIFASGDTPTQVENALREAHSHLEFTIKPELQVIQSSRPSIKNIIN